jgi:hypothetical protein
VHISLCDQEAKYSLTLQDNPPVPSSLLHGSEKELKLKNKSTLATSLPFPKYHEGSCSRPMKE